MGLYFAGFSFQRPAKSTKDLAGRKSSYVNQMKVHDRSAGSTDYFNFEIQNRILIIYQLSV